MASNATLRDDIIPYSVLRLDLGDQDATLTAICQGIRVVANVCLEDLQEDSSVAESFTALLRSVDYEIEAMEDLQDWMISPCMPLLKQAERWEHSSLQSFLDTETLNLTLVASDGRLEARLFPYSPSEMQYLIPRIAQSEPIVQQARQQGVPLYSASEVSIIRESNVSEWENNAMPTTVRVSGVQSTLFFKSVLDKCSFVREVDTLLRIRSFDESEVLSTSKLKGLVQWEDRSSICGLLVRYIPDSKTLDHAAEHATEQDRARWCMELRNTVAQLHSHDIVWGDVKLENVLIDRAKRSWVIDFGGGYCPDWVDESLQGTKSGDLQGLSRIEAYLEELSTHSR